MKLLNHSHDRERFAGESVNPEGDHTVPPDLFTADELSRMEAESIAMDAMYAAEAAEEKAELEWMHDPVRALDWLRGQHREANDDEIINVQQVSEVLGVSLGNGGRITAVVVCEDGVTRGLDAGYAYTSGSYDDPPDGDAWFEYTNDVEAFRAQHEVSK